MTILSSRLGLVLGLLAGLCGCSNQAAAGRAARERLPSVEVVAPTRTTVPVRIELTATVEPLAQADLCARVPGVVKDLAPDIDIGRPIRKGEVLVELAVPELLAQKAHKDELLALAHSLKRAAEAALQVTDREVTEATKQKLRYDADLATRQIETKRVRDLVERGAHQPERLQEATRMLEAAAAAVAAAEALVETRKAKRLAAEVDREVADSRARVAAAEVEAIARQVEFATIRAPFDGVITKRWVNGGYTVKDAGAPLLTVMAVEKVRVLLDIPERDVPLVNVALEAARKPGAPAGVVLRVPALGDRVPRGEFFGRLTRTAVALDPATRTMRTEVVLDNERGYLQPGMYGTAVVPLPTRADVLTVPTTAVVRRGDKTEVFVVEGREGDPPRGLIKRRPVQLGADDGKRVEVRDGLSVDDRIIAVGAAGFQPGTCVFAVPAAMSEAP